MHWWLFKVIVLNLLLRVTDLKNKNLPFSFAADELDLESFGKKKKKKKPGINMKDLEEALPDEKAEDEDVDLESFGTKKKKKKKNKNADNENDGLDDNKENGK